MTRARPTVSVIVPVFNSARTLPRCLESIAKQTVAPIETIVVDDGSTDGSAHLAERLGGTVLRKFENSGQSVARNLGASHARGEILFFLDSDVALDAGAVEAAVDALQQDPTIGAICGVYDPEPLLTPSLAARYRTAQQYVWFNEVEGSIPGLHSALFAIRAEVFAEIGPFNPALRHTEDQEYGYRLGKRYDVRVTPAIHGQHDHDATLGIILRKVFRRTRAGMPLWLRHRSLPGGAATGSRAWASVAVLLAALALPLPLWLGPFVAAIPPALIALAIGLDSTMYRQVFGRYGVLFGCYFTAVHLLVNLTSAVAAGVGVLTYLTQRSGHEAAASTGLSHRP